MNETCESCKGEFHLSEIKIGLEDKYYCEVCAKEEGIIE